LKNIPESEQDDVRYRGSYKGRSFDTMKLESL